MENNEPSVVYVNVYIKVPVASDAQKRSMIKHYANNREAILQKRREKYQMEKANNDKFMEENRAKFKVAYQKRKAKMLLLNENNEE